MSSFSTDNQHIIRLMEQFKCHLGAEFLMRPTDQPNLEYKKSFQKAQHFMEQGNLYYHQRRYDIAWKCYNRCVATAPNESAILAFAFSERSKMLFEFGCADLAIMDVHRAMSIPALTAQEKARMGKAQARKIGQNDYFTMAIEYDKTLHEPLHDSAIQKHLSRFVDLFGEHNQTEFTVREDLVDEIWKSSFNNPELGPTISEKVRVQIDETGKKSWIAVDYIEPGEILSNEKYYAAVTLSEMNEYSYCSYCNVWCEALIPCTTCTLEMYCNADCRQNAFEEYHKVECELLPWIRMFNEREEALLALRIFLIGTRQGTHVDHLRNLTYNDRIFGAREGIQILEEDWYSTILSLIWNADVNPLSMLNTELIIDMARIFIALRYSRCNFFNLSPSELEVEETAAIDGSIATNLNAQETLVASLLLHHAALVSVNSFPAMAHYLNQQKKINLKKVASGLPCLQSMLRHSCNPQVEIISERRRQVVVSIKPIQEGEQIFTAFYSDYGLTKLEDRKNVLKNDFGIECACVACRHQWPTLDILEEQGDVFENLPVVEEGNLDDAIASANAQQEIEKIKNEVKAMHSWLLQKVFVPQDYYGYKDIDLLQVKYFLKNFGNYLKEPSPTVYLCGQLIRIITETKSRPALDPYAAYLG